MLAQSARLAIFRALHGKGLTKVPGAKRIADAIKRNRRAQSIVHGFPVDLDAKDVLRLSIFGVYEPVETEIVKAHIKPGDVVLDIGAHVGYYSLLTSKLVGPAGRVYAFEPTPDTFGILSRNLSRNGIRNVTPVHAACGDSTRPFALYINPENCGDNHIFGEADSAGPPIPIPMVAVDDYLSPGQCADFVKMDIQGAEDAALRGMERTLTQSPGVRVLAEFWPKALNRAGVEPGNYLRRLRDFGFIVSHVDRAAKRLVPRSDDFFLTTDWIVDKGTNLWCERR